MTMPRANPPKVILVDDDAALLRALRFSLELEGFAVEAYETGENVPADALPRAGACLVIDYILPGEDGLALLTRLRGRGVVLPAIIVTSHARPALRRQAQEMDASIVEKPLLGPALISEIRTLLAQETFHVRQP
jgi:FixJ family two-component response regulator